MLSYRNHKNPIEDSFKINARTRVPVNIQGSNCILNTEERTSGNNNLFKGSIFRTGVTVVLQTRSKLRYFEPPTGSSGYNKPLGRRTGAPTRPSSTHHPQLHPQARRPVPGTLEVSISPEYRQSLRELHVRFADGEMGDKGKVTPEGKGSQTRSKRRQKGCWHFTIPTTPKRLPG